MAFSLKLAGHLGMTLGELQQRMTVNELKWWIAYHRFVSPFGDEWRRTARMIAALLAPYSRGRTPREEDFMPIELPPMTAEEIQAELSKLRR